MAEVDRLVDEMLRATTPEQVAQAERKAALWIQRHPQDKRKVTQAGEQLARIKMRG
jgi:hypothetical protein